MESTARSCCTSPYSGLKLLAAFVGARKVHAPVGEVLVVLELVGVVLENPELCGRLLLHVLQAYLGVIILQPHACAQRFRLLVLRRTRSFSGRTSAKPLK